MKVLKLTNQELIKILDKIFEKKIVFTNIEELGLSNPVEWDSLANLNILLEIEHVKGIKFSIDDFEKLTSIKSIKNYFNHD